ncbi:hypothetical protein GQR58_009481 [Nymphon striatum]|nr:hypothetical protein GQR58_018821 [Nymphon striatum]KAG1684194.1 hypothetical protein GQR58_009481 [Nymphon striatum]
MLVPPEFVNNPLLYPRESKLSQLDSKIKQILEQDNLDEDEKMTMYNNILSQFTDLHRQIKTDLNKGTSIMPQNYADITQDVVKSVPKNFKKKAEILMSKIANDGSINWDGETGVVSIDGRKLENSHIQDLINDAMRSRKKITPQGWKEFYEKLSSLNIPQDLIGNSDRWNFIQKSRSSPISIRKIRQPSKPYKRGNVRLWDTYK